MNFELNCRGFKRKLVERYEAGWGVQYVFAFDNGYGASVIKNAVSYGFAKDLWELAVLKITKDESGQYDWKVCYDTPITNDVVGWLTDYGVRKLLRKIKEL